LSNHQRRIEILEAVPSGAYRNPNTKYSIDGYNWHHYDDEAPAYNVGFDFVDDATSPQGTYWTNSFGAGAAGDYFIFGAPLGPRGSAWFPDLTYNFGVTGGHVVMELQTQPMDYLGVPNLPTPPDVNGTWVNWLNYIECYSATPFDPTASAWTFISGEGGALVIGGSGGTMMTAETGAAAAPYPPNSRVFNGGGDGSVMWYLRFRLLSSVSVGNVSGQKDFWISSFRWSRVIGGGLGAGLGSAW